MVGLISEPMTKKSKRILPLDSAVVHFAYSLEVGRAGVQTIIISNSGNLEQEGQVRGIIKYVVVTMS